MIQERKVLGIDVGTATTGWGVVTGTAHRPNLVAYGIISTSSKHPMPQRLKEIFEDLKELIEIYGPTEIAIESLFYFKNQTTVMTVSQARGVMLLASEYKGVPTFEYTPLQVKSAVTGYGKAEKKQVQEMIKNIFKLEEIPKPDDAADAVGIALCHLQSVN